MYSQFLHHVEMYVSALTDMYMKSVHPCLTCHALLRVLDWSLWALQFTGLQQRNQTCCARIRYVDFKGRLARLHQSLIKLRLGLCKVLYLQQLKGTQQLSCSAVSSVDLIVLKLGWETWGAVMLINHLG